MELSETAAVLVNHIKFDAFGRRLSETNANVDFRFSYTGREFDDDAELYYYRARWYDAETGRFVSEDPLAFEAGDTNLYRYVGNLPLTRTDPSGENFFEDLWEGVTNFFSDPLGAITSAFSGAMQFIGIPLDFYLNDEGDFRLGVGYNHIGGSSFGVAYDDDAGWGGYLDATLLDIGVAQVGLDFAWYEDDVQVGLGVGANFGGSDFNICPTGGISWSQSGGFGFDAGLSAGVAGFGGSFGMGYHGGEFGWNVGAQLAYVNTNISAYGQNVGFDMSVDWNGLNNAYHQGGKLPDWLQSTVGTTRGVFDNLPKKSGLNLLSGPLLGKYNTEKDEWTGALHNLISGPAETTSSTAKQSAGNKAIEASQQQQTTQYDNYNQAEQQAQASGQSSAWDDVKSWAGNAWNTAAGAINSDVTSVTETTTGIFDYVLETAADACDRISAAAKSTTNYVSSLWNAGEKVGGSLSLDELDRRNPKQMNMNQLELAKQYAEVRKALAKGIMTHYEKNAGGIVSDGKTISERVMRNNMVVMKYGSEYGEAVKKLVAQDQRLTSITSEIRKRGSAEFSIYRVRNYWFGTVPTLHPSIIMQGFDDLGRPNGQWYKFDQGPRLNWSEKLPLSGNAIHPGPITVNELRGYDTFFTIANIIPSVFWFGKGEVQWQPASGPPTHGIIKVTKGTAKQNFRIWQRVQNDVNNPDIIYNEFFRNCYQWAESVQRGKK